jgi:hypothetical protein
MFGMLAKSKAPFACECNSLLVEHDGELVHDQYARSATAPFALDESRPLACKYAGAKFELPRVELKRVPVKD